MLKRENVRIRDPSIYTDFETDAAIHKKGGLNRMVNYLRRAFLFALVLCMLFGCVSCNLLGNKPDDTESSDTMVETEAESEATVRVDKVDIKLDKVYASIVYSIDADDLLKEGMKTFANGYASIVGAKTVEPKRSAVHDADKAEILVGKVRYPECQEVYETLRYNEAKICVVGNKLVVAGYDSKLISEALTELLEKLEDQADANGNISLDGTFVIEKSFADPLFAVPVFEGQNPTFVETGDDCYMVNFGGVSKDKFEEYCDSMTDNGLTLYAEKTLEGNIYKTYFNDKYVVTTIYTKYNDMCKVLAEPLSGTALPTKAEDNTYTPVDGCDTTITQVGLLSDDLGETYNGMCYIVRLADGSFIVVDGGFAVEGYEDRIYNVLKKQAPDPDHIVIAAWMITHAHDDHVDVFENFFKSYADDVTVERFICNLPSDKQVENIWEPEWNRADKVRELIDKYFPNVPMIKAHPGQEFYIRNAKINILYTIDIYDGLLEDFNNTSVVFKLEAEGKKMIFLGDYDDNGKTMSNLYRMQTLKSDIMQVAHHGLPENSSNELSAKIQPKYAFWPSGAQVVKNGSVDLFTVRQNQYIVDNCTIFLAEDNIFVLKMKDCSVEKYETLADYLRN